MFSRLGNCGGCTHLLDLTAPVSPGHRPSLPFSRYVAFMGLQGAQSPKLNQILIAIQDCHPQKFLLPQIFLEASPNYKEICKIWQGVLDHFSRLNVALLPFPRSEPLPLSLSSPIWQGRTAPILFLPRGLPTLSKLPFAAQLKHLPSGRTLAYFPLSALPESCRAV